mgnify:CR=1 FL=1
MYRRLGAPDIRYGGEQAPVSGGVAPVPRPQLRDRVRERLHLKHHKLRSGAAQYALERPAYPGLAFTASA